jgi:hypothetical protein
MTESVKLSNRQAAAIQYAISHFGATAADIGAEVGVSARTVERWRASDDFRAAFEAEVDAVFLHERARAKLLFRNAMSVLETVLAEDSPASWATKVKAVRTLSAVLRDLGVSRSDVDDLRVRIVEIPAEAPSMEEWQKQNAAWLAVKAGNEQPPNASGNGAGNGGHHHADGS